ncbi:MAG TPA: hypothetical protein VET65_14165, partial [Candidatus Limnocylindrales bacterium]|nr:hypothetical protein [Candidatus Limnocylindrales bacterium]
LQAGDAIPMGPGPGAALPVITLEPNRQLALGGRLDGASITWAFGLYPVDDRRTRLVSRNLGFMPGWTLRRILFRPASWRTELPMRLFLDLGGFLMVRKMLSGIKQRAERFAREREAGEAALRLSSGCE